MKTPFGTEMAGDSTRSKRRRFVPLAIGGLVLSLLVGGAFAATITINGGTSVEFGQGTLGVVSCSGVANLTPVLSSTFSPSPMDGAFSPVNFTLAGVPDDCDQKFVRVSLYDEDGAVLDQVVFEPTLPVLASGLTFLSFTLDSTASSDTCSTATVSVCGYSTEPPATAQDIDSSPSYSNDDVAYFVVESFSTNPGASA